MKTTRARTFVARDPITGVTIAVSDKPLTWKQVDAAIKAEAKRRETKKQTRRETM